MNKPNHFLPLRPFNSFALYQTTPFQYKKVSFEADYQLLKLFMKPKKLLIYDYHPGMYFACVYDKQWLLGVIVQVSIASEYIMIKFMNKNSFT